MKKFASVFALLAVLAMAGSSLAGITIQVIPDPVNPNPAPGLTAWIVRGVGTEGTLIDTISAISIDGAVHNVWEFSNSIGTPYDNSGGAYFWNPEWEKYDTYRYHHPVTEVGVDPAPGDFIAQLGDDLVETNDGLNPAGLALADYPMAGFAPKVGEGTFGQSNEGTVCFVSIAELDILHVVRFGENIPLLDIRLLSDGTPTEFFDVPIGEVIPEPSTLILLVLGGLCLVGYRLRK